MDAAVRAGKGATRLVTPGAWTRILAEEATWQPLVAGVAGLSGAVGEVRAALQREGSAGGMHQLAAALEGCW